MHSEDLIKWLSRQPKRLKCDPVFHLDFRITHMSTSDEKFDSLWAYCTANNRPSPMAPQ
jgi:hypothetical protein